jgi:hypothetical protein
MKISAADPVRYPGPNVLVLTAAVYGMFLFAGRVLADGDTYWHIAAGNWMLAHRTVPHEDPFAFTTAGLTWVPHEWLGEIAMALAFRLGGWVGVVMLTAAAAALAIGMMARHLERWVDPLPAYALLMLTVLTLMPTMLARPHILALPVMEFWAARLIIARAEKQPPPFSLVLLMLLWTNLHGGFMIGLFLAGALAIEAVIEARAEWRKVAWRWGFFLLVAGCAAAITPHGLDGILFPLRMLRLDALRNIDEWRSPDFQSIQPMEFILLGALLLGFTRGVRLPFFRVLLFAGLVHSALQHTRFQLQLALLGFLLVAPALGAALRRPGGVRRGRNVCMEATALVGILLVLSVVRVAMPIARADEPGSPVSVLEKIPVGLRALPMLNAYRFGGFLIFHGVRPFVDSRADLYGDALLAEYVAIQLPQPDRVEAALSRYGIAWTMLEPGTGLVALLDGKPEWRRLYADDFAVVHVRRDVPLGTK